MTNDKPLQEVVETELGKRNILATSIHDNITDNLKHPLFEWQVDAIKYFLIYGDPAKIFGFRDKEKYEVFI